MAKDDEFDDIPFDDDDDGFGDFGLDDEFGKSAKRTPAEEIKSLGKATLKSAGKGTAHGLKAAIANASPSTGTMIDETIGYAGDLNRIRIDFMRDIQPAVNTMRSLTRALLPRAESILPDFVVGRLKKFSSAQEYSNIDDQREVQDATIATSLGEIFGNQQVPQYNNQAPIKSKEEIDSIKGAKIEEFVDRKMDMDRHVKTMDAMRKIHNTLKNMTNFHATIHTGYMKKNLELQYRKLFILQDHLKVTVAMAESTNSLLSAIKHNTSLPDIVKKRNSEYFIEMMKARTFESMSDKLRAMPKNIIKKIGEKAKEFGSDIKEGAESAVDMATMLENMDSAGMDVTGQLKEMATGFAGGKVGSKIGQFLGDKLFKANPELAAKMSYYSTDWREGLANVVDNFRREHMGAGGIKGFIADELVPDDMFDTQHKNLLAKTDHGDLGFDNISRSALITVIPGLLSKILVAVNRSSGRDEGELIFNYDTQKFVESDYKKDLTKSSLLKSAQELSGRLTSDIVRDASDIGIKTSATIEQDLRTFVVNVGMNGRGINSDALFAFIESEGVDQDLITNNYWLKMALKGIEDPVGFARFLGSYVVLPNGKPNYRKLRELKMAMGYVTREHDAFGKELDRIMNDHGQREVIGDLLDNKFEHNKEFLSKVYTGRDVLTKYDKYGNVETDKPSEDEIPSPMLKEEVAPKKGFVDRTAEFLGFKKDIEADATKQAVADTTSSIHRRATPYHAGIQDTSRRDDLNAFGDKYIVPMHSTFSKFSLDGLKFDTTAITDKLEQLRGDYKEHFTSLKESFKTNLESMKETFKSSMETFSTKYSEIMGEFTSSLFDGLASKGFDIKQPGFVKRMVGKVGSGIGWTVGTAGSMVKRTAELTAEKGIPGLLGAFFDVVTGGGKLAGKTMGALGSILPPIIKSPFTLSRNLIQRPYNWMKDKFAHSKYEGVDGQGFGWNPDDPEGKNMKRAPDPKGGGFFNMLGSMARGAGSAIGGIGSGIGSLLGNPLGALIGGGTSLVTGMAKGAKDLISGIFGGRGISKKHLQNIVGRRLDKVIYLLSIVAGVDPGTIGSFSDDSSGFASKLSGSALFKGLQNKTGEMLQKGRKFFDKITGKTAGDTDGDGVRDNSWQERMRKAGSSIKDRFTGGPEGGGVKGMMNTLGITGGLAGLTTMLKNRKSKEESGEEGDEDKDSGTGMMEIAGGTALGTYGMKALKGLGRFAGRGAGLLGRGALAAAKFALPVAGKLLLGAGALAGKALLGLVGLIASPVGIALLVTAGVGYGLYRMFTSDPKGGDTYDDFLKIRMDAYGFTDKRYYKYALKLEERVMNILNGKESDKFTDGDFEEMAGKLGFTDDSWFGDTAVDPMYGNINDHMPSDKKDEVKDRVTYVANWFRIRFSPLVAVLRLTLGKFSINYDALSKLKPEQLNTIIAEYKKGARSILDKTHMLIPYYKGYEAFKEAEAKGKLDPSSNMNTISAPTLQKGDSKLIDKKSQYNRSVTTTRAAAAFAAGQAAAQMDESGNTAVPDPAANPDISHIYKNDLSASADGDSASRRKLETYLAAADGSTAYGVEESAIMEKTKEWIKKHEGLGLFNYKDSLGYNTIGYGHLNKYNLVSLTQEEADKLFDHDFNKHYEEAAKLPEFHKVDPVRKAALVNLVFNMGLGGFSKFVSTRKKILEGKWSEVRANLLQSRYAQQVKGRANEVADVLATGNPNLIKGGAVQKLDPAKKFVHPITGSRDWKKYVKSGGADASTASNIVPMEQLPSSIATKASTSTDTKESTHIDNAIADFNRPLKPGEELISQYEFYVTGPKLKDASELGPEDDLGQVTKGITVNDQVNSRIPENKRLPIFKTGQESSITADSYKPTNSQVKMEALTKKEDDKLAKEKALANVLKKKTSKDEAQVVKLDDSAIKEIASAIREGNDKNHEVLTRIEESSAKTAEKDLSVNLDQKVMSGPGGVPQVQTTRSTGPISMAKR